MSRVRDTSARNGFPPRKRQTSLSGFFSKILPSHRAEQGGTARSRDFTNNSDSAYIDLGMNPNELTEWNLAQERLLRPPPPGRRTRSQHHKGRSWSIQRGRPRLRDDVGQSSRAPRRAPSLDLAQPPKPLGPPVPKVPSQARHDKSQPITTDELRDVLKTKEDTRKHRRSLKESGDWLGVQGADPYSGAFVVLTPTSTVSSETTPLSTKNRLAELSQRQRTAQLVYKQAKLEEETEKEKALLQKRRSKLEKLEQAKEELRSQQEFPTWSQHRRRWSSAAEPDLSPIPQSLKSAKVGGSNEAVSIRDFPRPSKSNGGGAGIDQPKLVERSNNSENTEPSKRDHGKDRSADTIVHKTLPNMKFQDMSIKPASVVYPSVFSDTDNSPPQEQKNEKRFLWRRRRRMSDPGKPGKRPNPLMTHSSAGKTEESLVPASTEHAPPIPRLQPRQELKDHFPDLSIPDPHLYLVPYSGRMVRMEKSLTTAKRDTSPVMPTRPAQSSHSEAQSKPALRIATNFSACRGPQADPSGAVSYTKGATAISFPSKLKGNTKPPPIYRRSIPIRSSSFQMRVVPAQESQIQTQNTSQTRNHIDTGLPKNTVGSQSVGHQSNSQEISRTEILNGHTGTNMNKRYGKDQGESASTPTIIITGFDPDPQLLIEGTQSRMGYRGDGKSSAVGSDETPVTSSSHSGGPALCNEPGPEKDWSTTPPSSRPTTPQSDLQSFMLAPETPETDTASADLAIIGVNPTPSAQYLQAPDSYRNPKTVLMKSARGKLEEIAAIYPQQQHVANEKQNTPANEFNSNTVGLPPHGQSNRAQASHQRQAPSEHSEHREAMIQEAARIAMRRSRAKEIITTRSRTPSRTPSPRTQETRPAILSHHGAKIPLENGGGGNGGVDTDFPFIRIGSMDLQPPPSQSQLQRLQHQSRGWVNGQKTEKRHFGEETLKILEDKTNGQHERSDENAEPGAIAILASFLMTAYLILFGLVCAWWVMVQPAFDQRSDLWKRRRKRESTREDVGVFAAAVVFCIGGVLIFASALQTGLCIVLQL
ncbi:hypothetical protein F4823DRAFT_146164 [Ustulina deusta]|nr:hypothetical protein F4823DRAFT_146164 [Ustulina deusta]